MTEWWAKYVGLEFRDGGRGPLVYDCWGLVRRVYWDRLRVELPSYSEISSRALTRVAREMGRAKDDGWVSPDSPGEMDVVLMRSSTGGRSVVHVGVLVARRRVLHIQEKTSAVVVPVDHYSVAGRIAGYRRLAEKSRVLS